MNRVEPQMIKNMPTDKLHAMESSDKQSLRVKEIAMSFGKVNVRLQNITKRFPGGVIANQGVTCEARSGEIHAILGENGAGKTTLMKILAGFHTPDTGQIEIDGQEMVFHSPKDAKLAGVGMVHQHFSLVPALTVGENLALGSPDTPLFLKPKQWNQHLMDSAEYFGVRHPSGCKCFATLYGRTTARRDFSVAARKAQASWSWMNQPPFSHQRKLNVSLYIYESLPSLDIRSFSSLTKSTM